MFLFAADAALPRVDQILAIVAALVVGIPSIMAWLQSRKNTANIKDLHIIVNNRLTELLASTARLSHAEGVIEGKAPNDNQLELAVKAAKEILDKAREDAKKVVLDAHTAAAAAAKDMISESRGVAQSLIKDAAETAKEVVSAAATKAAHGVMSTSRDIAKDLISEAASTAKDVLSTAAVQAKETLVVAPHAAQKSSLTAPLDVNVHLTQLPE